MPSPTGIRNLALQYLPGLIEEGLTNTEIVRVLKSEGMGYRNQNMFADINIARLEHFGAEQIRSMSITSPIPDRFMRNRSLPEGYPYAAVVKYEYRLKGSKTTYETGTMLFFDEAPSQEDVLAAYADRQATLKQRYTGFQFTNSPETVYYYKDINQ